MMSSRDRKNAGNVVLIQARKLLSNSSWLELVKVSLMQADLHDLVNDGLTRVGVFAGLKFGFV